MTRLIREAKLRLDASTEESGMPERILRKLLQAEPIAERAEHGKADGTYVRILQRLSRIQVLIIDDFGPADITVQDSRDLLETLDDPVATRSTIVAGQILQASNLRLRASQNPVQRAFASDRRVLRQAEQAPATRGFDGLVPA